MNKPQRGVVGRYAFRVTLMLSLAATGCGGNCACQHEADVLLGLEKSDLQELDNALRKQNQQQKLQQEKTLPPGFTGIPNNNGLLVQFVQPTAGNPTSNIPFTMQYTGPSEGANLTVGQSYTISYTESAVVGGQFVVVGPISSISANGATITSQSSYSFNFKATAPNPQILVTLSPPKN